MISVYICDICDIETHLQHLKIVFDRLREENLKIKPEKCEFLKEQITYLGSIISAEGIQPDPKKISVVKNFPTPRTPKDVKSFLGLTSFYKASHQGLCKNCCPSHHVVEKISHISVDP